MTTTAHAGKTTGSRAARTQSGTPGSGKGLGRRLRLRLWTLVHAQALLNGTTEASRYGPR